MSEAEVGREGVRELERDGQREGVIGKEREGQGVGGREGGRGVKRGREGRDKEGVKREGSNTCYIEHMHMYTELKLLPFCLSLKKY